MALARADDAENAAQGGGFAGAVTPEQGHQLAGLDLERNALEHMALVVVGMDRFDAENQAASPR